MDNTVTKKRQRMPNLVETEKLLLINLVAEHYHIVENKKTDSANLAEKANEWEVLAREFNAASNIHNRTGDNLKSSWENMKKTAKKVYLEQRTELFLTGGGVQKKRKDPLMDKVIGLIKSQVESLQNSVEADHFLGSKLLCIGSELTEHAGPSTSAAVDTPSTNGLSNDDSNESDVLYDEVDLEENEIDPVQHTQTHAVNGNWENYSNSKWRSRNHLSDIPEKTYVTPLCRPTSTPLQVDVMIPHTNNTFIDEESNKNNGGSRNIFCSSHKPKAITKKEMCYIELVRIKTEALKERKRHAAEQHEMSKNLFSIELEIAKEKQKQEALKTRLLELEVLEKETKLQD